MSANLPPISTIVRSYLALPALRLGFRLGSVLNPAATLLRAGALFTTPQASSRTRARCAPSGHALESSFKFDGQRIHTYTWGDPRAQPYVLFAHGWSSHGTRFVPWIDALRAAGLAVVAFDQVAHGQSSGQRSTLPDFARTLLAVGERFGPATALIGHSLGGTAATVALARGLVAERVILIAPAADPVAAVMRFGRFVRLPLRLCRRMVSMFEATAGEPLTDYQAHCNAPSIGRPALIVHDLEDREVPWSEGERYARFWSDSRLLSTQGLGHNRIAQDQSVIAAALRFLRGEVVGERVVSSPNLPYGIA